MSLAVRRPAHFQSRLALGVAMAAGACLLPFGLDAFWLSTAVFILIAAVGAVGLNVLTGYTGQVSLGHAFFLGVGAYTAAVLGDHGVNAAVWMPAAGAAAAVIGLAVGPTALRLRGLYLAIVSIGLVYVGIHLFTNVTAVTGGAQGRTIPQPRWGAVDLAGDGFTVLGVSIDRNGCYYFLSLLALALSMLFVRLLTSSRTGRAMQAVRDREDAAALLGVDVARVKLAAFGVSSFLAGACGALYAAFLSHVDPGQWNLLLSIQFVAIIIVGGAGTFWGPLLGSLFVTALPAVLEHFSDVLPLVQHSSGSGGIPVVDATDLMYGLLILVFLVVEPRGLAGATARLRGTIQTLRGHATAPAVEE